MGLQPRTGTPADGDPGGSNYVSTITAEELGRYNSGEYAEYADGYPSDEEEDNQGKSDKPSFANKISNAVRNFTLPSSDDIKNSNFVKSFQQPLIVKSKVQKPKVLEANQSLAAEKTPTELSKISKLSEFPLPSIKFGGEKEGNGDGSAPDGDHDEAGGGGGFDYGTLTRSLRETKLITTITECDPDDEELIKKMEITKAMSPSQLAEIHSIKDIPIPDMVKHMLDKPSKPASAAGNSATAASSNGDGEADGEEGEKSSFLSTKIVTNVKECTDYDTLKKRQEIVKTKSPTELAAISGLGDLPIPSKIENLMKGKDVSANDFDINSIKSAEFNVPKLFTMELAVTSVVEDEDVMKQHRDLAQNKSVAELSKVTSISDFPIPEKIENLMKRKDLHFGDETDSAMKSSNLSLSAITSGKIIPESLRETKLITNVKVEKDHDKLLARQTLIKNQTPVELGSIKNMSDLPIPTPLQNLHLPAAFQRSSRYSIDMATDLTTTTSPVAPPRQKSCNASIYESLPSSLRNEVIVRSRAISDEESKQRQELIRSKSPVELSQMDSLKDFPVPKTIEKLFEKTDETDDAGTSREPPVDFIEKYSTLPPSLKTNLLVGVKTEDQELVSQRAETIKSKSVSELSEIRSMNDIPIPSTLTRLARRDYAPVERKKAFKAQMKSQSTQSLSERSSSSSLTRSFREKQLLVSAKVQDPEVISARKSIIESKSVAELSKVSSLSDIPVPGFLSRLASRSLSRLHSLSTGQLNSSTEQDSKSGIYSTLPKSLNCELLVSKSVQDVSVLEQRMQAVSEKSTRELATIRSVKDFPVPDVVQRIYHKSMDRLHGTAPQDEDLTSESGGGMFRVPAMLSQPCIVTTKIEDPRVLLERQQLQQQKSIHELSKIRNLNEFPVPGNIVTLPDVPLPKLKNVLQLVARTPQRTHRPTSQANQTQTLPPNGQVEHDGMEDEDEYSNLEDSYEVIEKEEDDLPPPPPPLPAAVVPTAESPQAEVEPFGLATQIRGTPERSARSKKKKPEPRHLRRGAGGVECPAAPATVSDDVSGSGDAFETPPPLPPKRSPHKSLSVDSSSQPASFDEGDCSPPQPVKGVLTLEAMNGNIQVIKNETHAASSPAAPAAIQSRPLPAPPAPVRYARSSRESTSTGTPTRTISGGDMGASIMEESQRFQSCRETLTSQQSVTLLGTDDDDNTMADSIVDSLVSCTDTLICDDDTAGDDDDPYPSVNFDSGMTEVVDTTKTQGKRLEEGTQQLSQELMNHVESLRSTLDNMSNRLGARSRSRSSSRPRSTSRTRLNKTFIQEKM